jgi:hypothetical protein
MTKPSPNGVVRIDLDARRREATGAPIVVVVDDIEFVIDRRRFGLRMMNAVKEQDVGQMMTVLFGDDERIGTTIDLSIEEVNYIVETINHELGFDSMGESPGSSGSSTSITTRSKPISTAITG